MIPKFWPTKTPDAIAYTHTDSPRRMSCQKVDPMHAFMVFPITLFARSIMHLMENTQQNLLLFPKSLSSGHIECQGLVIGLISPPLPSPLISPFSLTLTLTLPLGPSFGLWTFPLGTATLAGE